MSAFLALSLAACVSSGKGQVKIALDPISADLSDCFNRVTAPPAEGSLSKVGAVRLITALHKSELEKNFCGHSVIDQYNSYNEKH